MKFSASVGSVCWLAKNLIFSIRYFLGKNARILHSDDIWKSSPKIKISALVGP